MLDEKAFFATINQVETLSLRTYGMTVKIYKKTANFKVTSPPPYASYFAQTGSHFCD